MLLRAAAALAALVVQASCAAAALGSAPPSAPRTAAASAAPASQPATQPAATQPAAGGPGGIAFSDSLPAAARRAAARKTFTIVYFSAKWCPWCRKMEATTFADREVAALAGRFEWVKLDADRSADLAAAMGVQGLPALLAVDADMTVLAARGGYVPPKEFVDLLRQWADKPRQADPARGALAALRQAAPATGPAASPQLVRAVEQLARPDQAARGEFTQAVAALGPAAWPGLCSLMADPRLAVRIAAGETLATLLPGGPEFDAFAPSQDRSAQVEAWRQWVAARASRPASGPATSPSTRPERAKP